MFVLISIVILLSIYLYSSSKYKYWSDRNVKHDAPVPVFGTHFNVLFGLKSITTQSQELYNKYKGERFIGYYRCRVPELIVNDLEMIRHVLNTDFATFHPRGLGRNFENQPLQRNLFHSEGDLWKLYRQRMTSAFTTSKLKNMFPLVVKCAEKMQTVADDIVECGQEYDTRELLARFTTEFIGACGFGIEMDTINKERSQFRELGREMFLPTFKLVALVALSELVPELTQSLYVGKHEVEDSMRDIFLNIRKQRNGKPIGRNDFIDLLLELEQQGKIMGQSVDKRNKDGSPTDIEMEMDTDTMMAQVFVFFAAGFETSSSATSFTLHQLAFHPEVQAKVQKDIDDVMSRYDNKLCYEAIAEMSYLDMAFKESMRMFPSLGVLHRRCTRRYTFPGTDITIDPGVKIIIPIQAIQNDERYFDNPTEFRPERFTQEAVRERNKYTYLPFGEGPRACIGARLGHMQSLAGLAALLHRFSFEPSESTRRQLEVNPKSNVVQAVMHGVPLKIKRRKF